MSAAKTQTKTTKNLADYAREVKAKNVTKTWCEKNLTEDDLKTVREAAGVYGPHLIASWLKDEKGHADATPGKIATYMNKVKTNG